MYVTEPRRCSMGCSSCSPTPPHSLAHRTLFSLPHPLMARPCFLLGFLSFQTFLAGLPWSVEQLNLSHNLLKALGVGDGATEARPRFRLSEQPAGGSGLRGPSLALIGLAPPSWRPASWTCNSLAHDKVFWFLGHLPVLDL